jgi:hypothetical protein
MITTVVSLVFMLLRLNRESQFGEGILNWLLVWTSFVPIKIKEMRKQQIKEK